MRTRTVVAGLALMVAPIVAAGCGGGAERATAEPEPTTVTAPATTAPTVAPATTTTTPVRTDYPPGTFTAADAALERRVQSAGLGGGVLRMGVADGTVIHEHQTGGIGATTPIQVASSTKWLTAATLMTFVDQGVIGLDDDIGRWLPEFAGSNPAITPRMLMTHTSGVRDNPCQNGGVALADCVRTLAASPREFAPGTAFSYGNSPFHVVGRLVEALGGADFATVVDQRLTGPLGMTSTTWPGAPAAPNPAFGVRTTVDDYGRFLAMLLRDGTTADGTRVLSAAAVAQLVTNQVGAYDTTHDYSVGITRIPRYALGAWPDVVDDAGRTVVVSGNGGKGLYPWVDFTTRTWGVVGVQDDRGAEVAVPDSQVVAVAARTALTP